MAYFDLRKSNHYESLVWNDFVSGFLFQFIRTILILLSAIFVASFLADLSGQTSMTYAGKSLALIIFGFTILEEIFYRFVRGRLRNFSSNLPLGNLENGAEINIADALDFEALNLFLEVQKFAKAKNIVISYELILYFLLDLPAVQFIFYRSEFSPKAIKKHFEKIWAGATEEIKTENFLLMCAREAQKRNQTFIDAKSMITILAGEIEELSDILFDKKIEQKDLQNLARWHDRVMWVTKHKGCYWEKENLPRLEGFSSDWAIAWTITLQHFTEDISKSIRYSGNPFGVVIGHEKELTEIERILSLGAKNNVLLVGEPGVGKTAVLYEFARRLFIGKVNKKLWYKHILDLRIGRVIAEAKTKGEIEDRIYQIFSESRRAGNLILYLDNVKSIISDDGVGTINASRVLLQYLNSPKLILMPFKNPFSNECHTASK